MLESKAVVTTRGSTPLIRTGGGEQGPASASSPDSPVARRQPRLAPVPGAHRPSSDAWMLRDAMLAEGVVGARVADLCAESGLLAISAALAGAAQVVAVDISHRAALTVALNARLNSARVAMRRGDLVGALGAERFDLIVSNPPCLPV